MLPYILLLAFPISVLGQVVGKASGFATGVTGGGSATPAVPKDTAQLAQWLTDATPRVIMIDKEYNFLTVEGKTSGPGCVPTSNTCGAKGQNALNGPNWCNPADKTYTYYVSPGKPIDIKSNKSLVGVGSKGVIRGKGFRIVNGAKNIIIQNVHITDLNPQYIWGGDAIQLSGSDMVWIDHNKFSLVGRQMIVTGFESAGRLTISNNEFDGQTSWSSSCNGQHYWTMLLIGVSDKITLLNNHFHHVSGRGPKVGSDKGSTLHAINNYFANSDGHNFDIAKGGNVLIEGNAFENCKKPIEAQNGNLFNVPNASSASQCTAILGRACVMNSFKSSGVFAGYTAAAALNAFKGVTGIPAAQAVDKVAAYVLANAGIGKSTGGTYTAPKPATTTVKAVATSAKPATTKAPVATAPATGSGTVPLWGQCGGTGWSGGKCVAGSVCKFSNAWYSQCLPA